ncbi:MAG: hypothetical protein JWM83_2909 [Candidatus Angelobacter sp.]|jgi:hypothetical protein|nr:hypothetical protein [Candidatus Angelobacter sp.]
MVRFFRDFNGLAALELRAEAVPSSVTEGIVNVTLGVRQVGVNELFCKRVRQIEKRVFTDGANGCN